MINSFMNLRKPISNKQKLQKRIRSSVLNLIIDRDMSFINVARKRDTNIIVSEREDYLEEFELGGKRYISIPSGLENKLSEMDEYEAEKFVDDLLRFSTADVETKYIDDDTDFNDEVTLRKNIKYLNVTGKNLDFNAVKYREQNRDNKQEKDNKDEVKKQEKDGEECALTEKGLVSQNEAKDKIFTEDKEDKQINYKFQDTDIESKFEDLNTKDNYFLSNSTSRTIVDENEMKRLANQIVKSFKGRVSKMNTIVPSKKLNAKKLCSDTDDRIYINQKGSSGKHLRMNLIIDMSGSMYGEPVHNAVRLIYIFNEIAIQGKLEGSVIWSESNHCVKSDFPMSRDFVKRMLDTGRGEGLLRNLNNNLNALKNVDTNICITDGDLADGAIDKEFYKKNKIEIIGVYVNDEAEDLTEYTGSLNRWFSKSLVRRSVSELAEKIVQLGLRKKGNQ